MPGKIYRHLAGDHQRLDGLLERAMCGETIDAAAYHQFRAGLLKHIGMEEKILLPAALLVSAPTTRVISAIRAILLRLYTVALLRELRQRRRHEL